MMKRVTKKLALIVVTVMAMAMCLVGCGSVQKDVDGDWTVSKVNGQDIAEWAACAKTASPIMYVLKITNRSSYRSDKKRLSPGTASLSFSLR